MKRRRRIVPPGRRGAAALKYEPRVDDAPLLAAKGMGEIADKIIAVAREAGIPLYEDPDLLGVLMTLSINDFIPPDLYMAVAETLAFVYRVNEGLAGD